MILIERDMKYARWKMAIARSLDWVDDKDTDAEGMFKMLIDLVYLINSEYFLQEINVSRYFPIVCWSWGEGSFLFGLGSFTVLRFLYFISSY